MLSKSRFNRRLHAVQDLLAALFAALGAVFKQMNERMTYCFHSFPVPTCDNIRIREAKIDQGEIYRGYCKVKRRYFHGAKQALPARDRERRAGGGLSHVGIDRGRDRLFRLLVRFAAGQHGLRR
jgi:hypothetical protein